jgi:selenide,water dikinase
MAHLSHVGFEISFNSLQWYAGATQYAQADIFPGGMHRNRDYFSAFVTLSNERLEWQEYLLYDPQTSGGLLIAVDASHADSLLADLLEAGEAAAIIGTVMNGDGTIHVS